MQLLLPQTLLSLIALAIAAPGRDATLESALGDTIHLERRAFPNSPSGGYAPGTVDCPSTRPSIRSARNISTSESEWLTTRRQNVLTPLTTFLTNSNITGFDAESYISSNQGNLTAIPNIGIAVSGGGYRALMNGAGFIAAADSRVNGTTEAYGIGGLLQASTYLAGLSGGGWLVGSIYANNFSTVEQLRDGSTGSSIWAFDRTIIQGPEDSGLSILNTAEYWNDVSDAVSAKRDAGFETSITDYWGRVLSYQLINATDGGPAYTFSSIAQSQDFLDANQPMPILVADGRVPGTLVVSLNATVYEMNPWEMGSFDPTVFGFAPMQYVGSNFSQGELPDNVSCVSGFDQFGYVMGTSSSLFNQFILQNLSSSSIPSFLVTIIENLLQDLGADEDDIAEWEPNPFYGYDPTGNNYNVNSTSLTLVDGGEDLQNIPLHPLIQPERAVDVIFAVDSSADTTYAWPNGTALRATYERSMGSIGNGTQFPAVPDAETFINSGLNSKPTFFGCDANNFTGTSIPPLIVYIANTPYTAWSNVTTYDLEYSDTQRNEIIQNGFNVATMGNATVADGASWRTCIGCAVMSRTWSKAGADVPSVCQDCFNVHCWDGTINNTAVTSYEPEPVLTLETDSASVSFTKQGPVALMSYVLGITCLLLVL